MKGWSPTLRMIVWSLLFRNVVTLTMAQSLETGSGSVMTIQR